MAAAKNAEQISHFFTSIMPKSSVVCQMGIVGVCVCRSYSSREKILPDVKHLSRAIVSGCIVSEVSVSSCQQFTCVRVLLLGGGHLDNTWSNTVLSRLFGQLEDQFLYYNFL